MTAQTMQEKTAVFSFGSLPGAEEPHSYDIDEPTRELPLIAGRFAGREWAPEDLRREFPEENSLNTVSMRRRSVVALTIGTLAAMVLLVMSLLGQAKLVGLNERANALSAQADALRQEQNVLIVRAEQVRAETFSAGPETVQITAEPVREDQATVLNLRRGHEMDRYWRELVDTLGVSFR